MKEKKNRSIKMINRVLVFSLTSLIMLPGISSYAQEDLNKEVRVVKAYNPTISDAFKAKFIPVLDDTVKVETSFNYFIEPVKQPIQFRVKSLESARLRPESREQLKNSYVRAGFGNYWTPMAEMDINTTRNPNTSLGFNMSHLSSQGKIKMGDDRKVYSGFADNQVKLYGSRINRNSTLSADLHFNEDHYFLYGYDTDTLSDSSLATPMALRATTKDSVPYKRYMVVGSALKLKSDRRTRKGFAYELDLKYDYLNSLYRDLTVENPESEHGGGLRFAFSHELKKLTYGAETEAQYFYHIRSADSLGNMIIRFDPWIAFNWEIVSLQAGPKVAVNRFDEKPYFFPRVKLMVNITNTVVPYVGLDGYYESNHLLKIKGENPYLMDDLAIDPTIHKLIAYGGLRGRFLPKASFNLFVRWQDVQNWHFYIADTTNPLMNRFDVVYNDGTLLTTGGEIGIHPSQNLGFILKGNYYKYSLDKYRDEQMDYAWHRPEWDISLTTRYSFLEKVTLQADVYLIGPQFAPAADPLVSAKELDGLIDINISGEYQINEDVSAFARVNNIISDSYYVWQNYPIQGLNFLLGATWSF